LLWLAFDDRSHMHVPRLIERKRDGGTLTFAEIERLIAGYVAESVPDYQMAAWAMAVFFQGLSAQETVDLTRAMWHSGGRLQRQTAQPLRVDEHSTGGVGDKVSLPLAPLLACCGLHVPMISGRGLGATGGTLDKLEAIPGFRTNLAADEIEQALSSVGCVITGQTADLVPADRKLYALRDVTGTVPSIPLIAASILSKKLAEDLDVLVLDVKWGTGAFMGSLEDAHRLAQTMVTVAQALGLSASAIITDMNQPLGRMVGHAVEVNESLDMLEGSGPEDLKELTLALGAQALVKAGLATSTDEANALLLEQLATGQARERFAHMVVAQGGDLDQSREVGDECMAIAPRPGYIAHVDTAALGHAVALLGGGRRRQGDAIDHAVGFEMLTRLGDTVREGDPLARLFVRKTGCEEALAAVIGAIDIRDEPPLMHPLIVENVGPTSAVDFLHGIQRAGPLPRAGG
jgi:pyrimidine-nucleoside phosphorylase